MMNHKLSRLCGQVEEAVSMALFSSRDPILRDLYVIEVSPIKGAAKLRVSVSLESQSYSPIEVEEALDRARGYLRSEVATEINRKKAPELVIEFVPWNRKEY